MAAITRKKGETVHMYAFTGMYLGEFEITASDKKTISIVQKNGRTTKFDRETGKQVDAKTPRCASRVTEEKEPEKKKAASKKSKKEEVKKPVKKTAKKAKPEPEEACMPKKDDDEEYEDA
jgi:hypothetical protein